MEKKMKSYHQKFVSDHPYESSPMAEIAGFPVRPGIYDLNGATPLQNGVNFTIHTCGGTSCELLLFHRAQEEPFAVLPFPEAYKIGDVYSMIVYGLNIDEFEYAYRVDGPYCPEKGLLFDKNKMDDSINQFLTQFLGRWNINCYKDEENNFYIKQIMIH